MGRSFWTGHAPAIKLRVMELLDYTADCAILPRINCRGFDDAIRLLVERLVTAGVVTEPDPVVAEILHRESEGSTAIGGGLAIPHARHRCVERIQLATATLTEPLAVATEDGQPLDVVILIVGPLGDPRQMLRILARLARLVKHSAFLDELRGCTSAAAVREVIVTAEKRLA